MNRNEVLYRHTARAGDVIALTGPVGGSGMGCELLLESPQLPQKIAQPLIYAHLDPRPHVREGRVLAASGWCTAAIDVSDGVSSDLGHLCRDSFLAAVIHEDRIPASAELREAASFEAFEGLNVDLDLVRFFTRSEAIFKFYEELAAEQINFSHLAQADAYAEFGEHLDTLEQLLSNYAKLLESRGMSDKARYGRHG